jgi:hypothetical protein
LKDILGILFVLQQPPAHAEDERTMPANQPCKRFFIAVPCEPAQ